MGLPKIKTLTYVNLVDLPGGREAHEALADCSGWTFGDTAFTLVSRNDLLEELDGMEPAFDVKPTKAQVKKLFNALHDLDESVYVNLEG